MADLKVWDIKVQIIRRKTGRYVTSCNACMALYGAETWTLRATDQKRVESSEMWCWRRMEKISWTDHVRSEEVLLRVNEQRNILHEIRERKANWIGNILRRNCLLQQVVEGKIKGQIEVTRRRGRRRKKLLDDLKDRRWYCHLKEEALDRTMWRNRFGRGFGPVFRQITDDDDGVGDDVTSNNKIRYRISWCFSVAVPDDNKDLSLRHESVDPDATQEAKCTLRNWNSYR